MPSSTRSNRSNDSGNPRKKRRRVRDDVKGAYAAAQERVDATQMRVAAAQMRQEAKERDATRKGPSKASPRPRAGSEERRVKGRNTKRLRLKRRYTDGDQDNVSHDKIWDDLGKIIKQFKENKKLNVREIEILSEKFNELLESVYSWEKIKPHSVNLLKLTNIQQALKTYTNREIVLKPIKGIAKSGIIYLAISTGLPGVGAISAANASIYVIKLAHNGTYELITQPTNAVKFINSVFDNLSTEAQASIYAAVGAVIGTAGVLGMIVPYAFPKTTKGLTEGLKGAIPSGSDFEIDNYNNKELGVGIAIALRKQIGKSFGALKSRISSHLHNMQNYNKFSIIDICKIIDYLYEKNIEVSKECLRSNNLSYEYFLKSIEKSLSLKDRLLEFTDLITIEIPKYVRQMKEFFDIPHSDPDLYRRILEDYGSSDEPVLLLYGLTDILKKHYQGKHFDEDIKKREDCMHRLRLLDPPQPPPLVLEDDFQALIAKFPVLEVDGSDTDDLEIAEGSSDPGAEGGSRRKIRRKRKTVRKKPSRKTLNKKSKRSKKLRR
jgi:hypothetical protein